VRRAGSRTCGSRWSACSRRRSRSQAWMSCHAVPRPSLQQFAIVVRVSANSCAVIHQLYWVEQKGSSGSPTVRRKYPRTAIMSSIHGWPAPDCTPQKPSPPVHPVDAGELLAARLVSVLIDAGRPTALALRFPGPIETHSRDSQVYLHELAFSLFSSSASSSSSSLPLRGVFCSCSSPGFAVTGLLD